MNTYKIILRSEVRTISLGALFMIIFLLIAGFVFPKAVDLEKWLLIIVTALIAHFSIRKLAIARTEWILSEDGISIKWLTNYYGIKINDFDIKWEDIKKYNELYGRGYDLFKIHLFNGDTLRFGHGGLFIRDDFDKFYADFQEMFIKKKHPEDWAKYYKKKSK